MASFLHKHLLFDDGLLEERLGERDARQLHTMRLNSLAQHIRTADTALLGTAVTIVRWGCDYCALANAQPTFFVPAFSCSLL